MNELLSQPDQKNRSSALSLLIYVVILLALIAGIGVISYRMLTSTGTIVGQNPLKVAQPTVPPLATPLPNTPLGSLAIEVTPQRLRILSRGAVLNQFTPPESAKLQWLAIIRNPYAPLQISAGSPFLESTKLKLPISDNIGSVLDSDGRFRALTEKDFVRFPFFSSGPTTIGFIFGSSKGDDQLRGATLYFMDTASDAVATIHLPQLMFPEWLRDKGSPPPFVIKRVMSLSGGAGTVGDVVITSVQSYAKGRYDEDPALGATLAGEEFKKALLTKEELAALKRTEFSKAAAPNGPLAAALQKVVRLLWYGKVIGRNDALGALIDQLHPTTARAIRESQYLNPK